MPQKSKLLHGNESIDRIAARGFKSLNASSGIDIAPLTVIAGANSSGKSSLMQAVLLLKQTLEAPYDPGPLLLSGPDVQLTSSESIFTRISGKQRATRFRVGVWVGRGKKGEAVVKSTFSRAGGRLLLDSTENVYDGHTLNIDKDLVHAEAVKVLPPAWDERYHLMRRYKERIEFFPRRNRCFWELWYFEKGVTEDLSDEDLFLYADRAVTAARIAYHIKHIIHVPGLRGNPVRAYPVTAFGSTFPGPFESYSASVIAAWQSQKNSEKLKAVRDAFQKLGLTWSVKASPLNETQVEIMVGRLTKAKPGGARDLVNIADVGFGVSQVLPVIVALQVAEPGQMVYVEQPEIHLHPRAQVAMAEVLAQAAERGVRVVVETHSSLLLLAVQTLVAEGKLDPAKVKLHWFNRDESTGFTKISTADLTKKASFGDWPEDFGKVILSAQARFLDAVES
jgi:hypothetical protein